MRVLGFILAGGKSSRMGTDKAFIELGGKSLLQHVYERLSPQCDQVLVNADDDPRFAGYTTVADTIAGQFGPLAGILAGLEAAKNKYEWLVTTPVDCPFLPHDLVKKLVHAAQMLLSYSLLPLQEKVPDRADEGCLNCKIIIASSNTQPHYTTCLWHISLIEPLHNYLKNGSRKMQDFTQSHNPQYIEWNTTPIDPFFNINTQDDLALASIFLKSLSATPI